MDRSETLTGDQRLSHSASKNQTYIGEHGQKVSISLIMKPWKFGHGDMDGGPKFYYILFVCCLGYEEVDIAFPLCRSQPALYHAYELSFSLYNA
jgi:hypothetical protein